MRKRFTLTMSLLLAAAFPISAKPPAIGELAPDFELILVSGEHVKLSQLRGRVIVLNFWATWCGPCKRELPLLDAFYEIQRPFGLSVYAVTTEDSLPIGQLKKLFAFLLIPSVRHLRGNYRALDGVPTNYVIDRSGRLRYAKAAAFDLDDLNKLIVPLLNEPVPVTPNPTSTR